MTGGYTQSLTSHLPPVSAWAGRIDRSAQLVALVRRLRTAAPGDHAIGDPLSLSGMPAAAVVMAVFPTPEAAIRAVYRARAAMAEVEVDGYRPRMRVGIHTGSPLPVGGDWLGVDVTVAARTMESGGDGHVMVTQSTLDRLDPTVLAELGVVDETYRRPRWEPRPTGMPDDVVIRRLVEYRAGTRGGRGRKRHPRAARRGHTPNDSLVGE